MPFSSRAQERMAFATHKPWAKEWASKTDQEHLPERAGKGGDVKAKPSKPGAHKPAPKKPVPKKPVPKKPSPKKPSPKKAAPSRTLVGGGEPQAGPAPPPRPQPVLPPMTVRDQRVYTEPSRVYPPAQQVNAGLGMGQDGGNPMAAKPKRAAPKAPRMKKPPLPGRPQPTLGRPMPPPMGGLSIPGLGTGQAGPAPHPGGTSKGERAKKGGEKAMSAHKGNKKGAD